MYSLRCFGLRFCVLGPGTSGFSSFGCTATGFGLAKGTSSSSSSPKSDAFEGKAMIRRFSVLGSRVPVSGSRFQGVRIRISSSELLDYSN